MKKIIEASKKEIFDWSYENCLKICEQLESTFPVPEVEIEINHDNRVYVTFTIKKGGCCLFFGVFNESRSFFGRISNSLGEYEFHYKNEKFNNVLALINNFEIIAPLKIKERIEMAETMANDPIFQQDVETIMEDFKYVDQELWEN